MAVNRGKTFESKVEAQLNKIPNVSIDRLHDQTTGYAGSSNICDYIVYKKPYEYYLELKSVHGNTISIYGNDIKHKYGNISNKQWEGLLEKASIDGVFAGVIVWWIDKDITKYISIQELQAYRNAGHKSIRYDADIGIIIHSRKLRVFFNYDWELFFHSLEKQKRRNDG